MPYEKNSHKETQTKMKHRTFKPVKRLIRNLYVEAKAAKQIKDK